MKKSSSLMIISKKDMKYFEKARKVATISDFSRVNIGCVAIYHRNIIGMGCNTNKTHPTQRYYDKYREYFSNLSSKLHAEINCLNQIKNLNINFAKVKLYIYRIRKDQPFGLARPCPSCMAAIKDLGIKEIYYTTNEGYSYEYLENITVGGVL